MRGFPLAARVEAAARPAHCPRARHAGSGARGGHIRCRARPVGLRLPHRLDGDRRGRRERRQAPARHRRAGRMRSATSRLTSRGRSAAVARAGTWRPSRPERACARRNPRGSGRPHGSARSPSAEERGDRAATRIMEYARHAFAVAAVTIVNLYNPQRIVVGGAVANGQGDRLLQPARDAINRYAFERQAARVRAGPGRSSATMSASSGRCRWSHLPD